MAPRAMRLRVWLIAYAVILGGASVARAAEKDPTDEKEAMVLRARSPHAAELLQRGEAVAASGQEEAADALFLQALAENKESSLIWRRHCEARTALGPRSVAIQACTKALELSRSGPNWRGLVGAFVDGPVSPSTRELFEALIITARANKETSGQPTAAAMACEIAERIGDGVMLQRCAEELERLAPDDPATKKALSRLAERCPRWRLWLGWLAIGSAVLATCMDALRRLVRRWPKRRATAATLALICAALSSLAGSKTALADEATPPAEATPKRGWLSKWTIDREHPEAHIPSEKDRNGDPLQFGYWIQDLIWKGEHASKAGDHVQAAKFFVALADAVPDRAVGYTLACQEYEALGELDHAISACGQGLLHDGVLVKDYTHFVHLVLAKPKLGHKETDALATVLAHMHEDPTGRDFVDDLECEVGVRTSNVAQLRECTAALAAKGKYDSKLLSYQWDLAVQESDFRTARELIERAKAAGVPAGRIADMLKATASRERWHWIRVGLVLLGFALFCSGIGVAARTLRRRRTGSDSGAPPSPPSVANAPVPG
jgi:tetratricopeptide (TPR) repeat protein